MFVILTYDVNQKRVGKVLKICKRYLNHVQKSVFEGMITDAKLNKLKREIEKTIEPDEDECCLYEFASLKYTRKERIGSVDTLENIF